MTALGPNMLKDFLGKVGETFVTRVVVMGISLFVSVFTKKLTSE